MKDIFIQCPYCKRAVSKRDLMNATFDRYSFTFADALMPIPCLHCGKASYPQEWKEVEGVVNTHLTDDLFEI